MKIAEIGWNFMGDMQLAKQMIESAKKSGATHVKFQYWRESNLKPGEWDNDGRREIYKSSQLNDDRIKCLNDIAKLNNLNPFYSVFSLSGLEKLKDLGEKTIKIPSHEIHNLKLISKAYELFDFVILSTGACEEKELIELASITKKFQGKLVVMHCVSSYPCLTDNINLPRLDILSKLFPYAIMGLSDHTSSIIIPAVSVAYGVKVIEKHFTIDHSLPGRDNKFALLPDQFKLMCLNFDEAIKACEYHGAGVQNSELDIIKNYRGRWGG
jgi:sialic acid synthase SpsE